MIFEFFNAHYDPCGPDERPTFFGFSCPKRPDHMCTGLVLSSNPGRVIIPDHTWGWNGDREKPTFWPSIDCKACSHGWIENGQWRDA